MIGKLDYLAQKTIDAFEQFSDMPDSWIRDKAYEFEDMDRLAVLRSFTSLDSRNLEVICSVLDVSVDDMRATFRVLTKI